MQSALVHDRSAEFQLAVSALFRALGDDLHAARARELGEEFRNRAAHERACAGAVARVSGSTAA